MTGAYRENSSVGIACCEACKRSANFKACVHVLTNGLSARRAPGGPKLDDYYSSAGAKRKWLSFDEMQGIRRNMRAGAADRHHSSSGEWASTNRFEPQLLADWSF